MSKKKKKKPNDWYELIAHFDANAIQAIPVEGRAFLMGKVQDVTVVEVGRGMPDKKLQELAAWLEDNGIEALVVTEGVRFLKLKPATPAERDLLEAHLRGEIGGEASSSAGD